MKAYREFPSFKEPVSAAEWDEVTVDDIKALSPYALATGPFGSSIGSRFFQDHGVPVIRGSNLSEDIGERLRHKDLVFISEEKAKEFQRSIARKGDLIFTCWGTIGQVGLIEEQCPFREYVVSNKQMKFTPNPQRADSLFLYYVFSGPEVSGQIKNQAIGSSVPGFNLGQLRSIRFSLPPLDEQRAIARILGSLDDKIELNRKMNHTLEAMAAAIFKSWFVNFDPVIAKAEGRKPYGMSAAIAALFPDRFQDSEIGPIPEGWSLLKWGNIATLEYGKALRNYENTNGPYRVFGTNGPIGWHTVPLCTSEGVIIGRKGAYRGIHYSPDPFFVIDTAFYLSGKRPLSMKWVFYELRRIDLDSVDAGSAIPSTTRDSVYSLDVCFPSKRVMDAFERIASPLFAKRRAIEQENMTLAKVRDTLLPKLLSGELRVKQAEKLLKTA